MSKPAALRRSLDRKTFEVHYNPSNVTAEEPTGVVSFDLATIGRRI